MWNQELDYLMQKDSENDDQKATVSALVSLVTTLTVENAELIEADKKQWCYCTACSVYSVSTVIHISSQIILSESGCQSRWS